MAYLPATVEQLARIGVNLEIEPQNRYLPATLESIVRIVVSREAHITIHAGTLLPQTLETLAQIGGKNLTIKL